MAPLGFLQWLWVSMVIKMETLKGHMSSPAFRGLCLKTPAPLEPPEASAVRPLGAPLLACTSQQFER